MFDEWFSTTYGRYDNYNQPMFKESARAAWNAAIGAAANTGQTFADRDNRGDQTTCDLIAKEILNAVQGQASRVRG